jgi:hypothetical protein
MDLRRALEPQGLNWWTIVSGMGMNFVMTSFLFLFIAFSPAQEMGQTIATLIMAIGGFLIPLLTAYICGRLSDERYLAYAFYPLIGYLVLTVPGILLGAGVFGILMVALGVLGAFNGANLVARRAMRRRQAMREGLDLEDR